MVFRFSEALQGFRFVASLYDHSVFTYSDNDDFLVLLVYVDDVVLTGTTPNLIHQIKEFIHAKFSIKDLGSLHYFLGIEVARSSSG